MDLLFVVWARWLSHTDLADRPARPFPDRRRLAAFALVLGAVAFLTRQVYPVGASVLFGLQIGYFPSYVAMFILGLVAWRCRWLDDIPDRAFAFAKRLAVLGVLAFPFILVAGAATSSNPAAAFAGGLHWQALAYALWEPWVLVGVSIVLLRWGQRRLNRASPAWEPWTSGSYIAYIVQPLPIVAFAIALQGAGLPALVKLAIVGAASIAAAFLVARALRLIRAVRTAIG